MEIGAFSTPGMDDAADQAAQEQEQKQQQAFQTDLIRQQQQGLQDQQAQQLAQQQQAQQEQSANMQKFYGLIQPVQDQYSGMVSAQQAAAAKQAANAANTDRFQQLIQPIQAKYNDYFSSARPPGAASGNGYSPHDDVFRKYAGNLANDDEFIKILAAASKAESGWDNKKVGDNGHSIGLFQLHDQGAGSGLSVEQRENPEVQAQIMVPRFAAAYQQLKSQGLTGSDLMSAVARQAERPYDYQNPDSAAANNYKNAYDGLGDHPWTGAVGHGIEFAGHQALGHLADVGSTITRTPFASFGENNPVSSGLKDFAAQQYSAGGEEQQQMKDVVKDNAVRIFPSINQKILDDALNVITPENLLTLGGTGGPKLIAMLAGSIVGQYGATDLAQHLGGDETAQAVAGTIGSLIGFTPVAAAKIPIGAAKWLTGLTSPENREVFMNAFQDAIKNAPQELGKAMANPGVQLMGSGVPLNGSVFTSKLDQVVSMMPNRMPREQMASFLKSKGVKLDEMKWSGMDDYLAKNPMISKSELQDYLAQNNVKLEETTYSGNKQVQDEPVIKERSDGGLNYFHGDDTTGPFASIFPRSDGTFAVSTTYPSDALSSRYFSNLDDAKSAVDDMFKKYNPPTEETRFGAYRLPGGDNYKEFLLSTPKNQDRAAIESQISDIRQQMSAISGGMNTEDVTRMSIFRDNPQWTELSDKLNALKDQLDTAQPEFSGSHWDVPNVVAHIRTTNRTLPDGQKMLFVEEIQSDWHQQGREQGYAGDTRLKDKLDIANEAAANAENALIDKYGPQYWNNAHTASAQAELADFYKLQEEADKLANEYASMGKLNQPQQGPFSKTWPELAVKRIMQYAATHGYDKVGFATGEIQSGAHDLTRFRGGESDTGNAAFYDEILPNLFNNIGKKFGARVGEDTMQIPTPASKIIKLPPGYDVQQADRQWIVYRPDGSIIAWHTSEDAAVQEAITILNRERVSLYGPSDKSISVHSLDITPQMRESLTNIPQQLFMGINPTVANRAIAGAAGGALSTPLTVDDPTSEDYIKHAAVGAVVGPLAGRLAPKLETAIHSSGINPSEMSPRWAFRAELNKLREAAIQRGDFPKDTPLLPSNIVNEMRRFFLSPNQTSALFIEKALRKELGEGATAKFGQAILDDDKANMVHELGSLLVSPTMQERILATNGKKITGARDQMLQLARESIDHFAGNEQSLASKLGHSVADEAEKQGKDFPGSISGGSGDVPPDTAISDEPPQQPFRTVLDSVKDDDTRSILEKMPKEEYHGDNDLDRNNLFNDLIGRIPITNQELLWTKRENIAGTKELLTPARGYAGGIPAKNPEYTDQWISILKGGVQDFKDALETGNAGETGLALLRLHLAQRIASGSLAQANIVQRLLSGNTKALGQLALFKQLGVNKNVHMADVFAKFADASDSEIARLAAGIAKDNPNLHDYGRAMLYFDLLSPIQGRIRDFTSAVSLFGQRIPADITATAIDKLRSDITGNPRSRYMSDVMAGIGAIPDSLDEASRIALQIVKDGQSAGEGISRSDLVLNPGKGWENAGTELYPQAKMDTTSGKISTAIGMPSRIIRGPVDAFVRTLNRSYGFRQLAMRESIKAGGTQQEILANYNDLLKNPTTEMITKAFNEADRANLQERTGIDPERFLRSLSKNAPYVQPFYLTPWNITVNAMEHGPLAPLWYGSLYGLRKAGLNMHQGEYLNRRWGSVADAEQTIARMLGGFALTGMGMMLYDNGNLTGAPPLDKPTADLWNQQGKTPYSVRVGGKWVPYWMFLPLAAPLSAAPVIAKLREGNGGSFAADMLSGLESTMVGSMLSAFDQSYFKTFVDIANVLSGNPSKLNVVGSAATHLTRSVISEATPGIYRDLINIFDGAVRDVSDDNWLKSQLNYTASRLPFVEGALPQEINPYGQPMSKTGAQRTLNLPLPSSGPSSGNNLYAVDNNLQTQRIPEGRLFSEMDRLGYHPGDVSKDVQLAGETITLPRDLWRQYQAYSGRLAMMVLAPIVNSPTWDSLPDKQRAVVMRNAFTTSRSAIRKYVDSNQYVQSELDKKLARAG